MRAGLIMGVFSAVVFVSAARAAPGGSRQASSIRLSRVQRTTLTRQLWSSFGDAAIQFTDTHPYHAQRPRMSTKVTRTADGSYLVNATLRETRPTDRRPTVTARAKLAASVVGGTLTLHPAGYNPAKPPSFRN